MSDYQTRNICKPGLDLSTSQCGKTSGDLQESYVAQVLDISGAPINIFKLLGIHEQGTTIDLAKNGIALASSSQPGFEANNAFTTIGSWRSIETGNSVLGSYIGYDFGAKKQWTGTQKYSNAAPVMHHISTIMIKQSVNPSNRVLQARIDRWHKNRWVRVDIVNLPDSDELAQVSIKSSSMSDKWRIVPIFFAGGSSDYWEVQELQLLDYEATSLSNIQDKLFLENRDRCYSQTSVQVKCQYDLQDDQADLSRFGIQLANVYTFTVSFLRLIESIGRPLVVGDIIEIPAEMQYDFNLKSVKRYLEVTDVHWDPMGYTTDWRPTLLKFTAQPVLATQEVKDLFGTTDDSISDDVFAINKNSTFASIMGKEATENLEQEATNLVPETGESSTINSDKPILVETYPVKVDGLPYDGTAYSIEDGLPPNGLPYTEGTDFPASPSDNDYHRIIYNDKYNMNPRLYRYSSMKSRWIFMEEDRRKEVSAFKPSVNSQLKIGQPVKLNGEV